MTRSSLRQDPVGLLLLCCRDEGCGLDVRKPKKAELLGANDTACNIRDCNTLSPKYAEMMGEADRIEAGRECG
eukprot:1381397-Pleurochrysis_carterae.AAC.2